MPSYEIGRIGAKWMLMMRKTIPKRSNLSSNRGNRFSTPLPSGFPRFRRIRNSPEASNCQSPSRASSGSPTAKPEKLSRSRDGRALQELIKTENPRFGIPRHSRLHPVLRPLSRGFCTKLAALDLRSRDDASGLRECIPWSPPAQMRCSPDSRTRHCSDRGSRSPRSRPYLAERRKSASGPAPGHVFDAPVQPNRFPQFDACSGRLEDGRPISTT